LKAAQQVALDSTPGFPCSRIANTNKAVLESHGDAIVDKAVERLFKILLEDVPASAEEILREDWHDPCTPFIKREPHPSRKSVDGKWRIVSCLSIVDQLVERVILSRAIFSIKLKYPYSDVVIGIGFTDQMNEEFHSRVRQRIGPDVTSTDISGWDRVLGATWLQEAAESVIRSEQSKSPNWQRAVRNHAYMMVRPSFIIPNGTNSLIVTRIRPGGQISGGYQTTAYNGLARVDVSNVAGSDICIAAGDDALESFPRGYDYLSRYEEMGFTVRQEDPAPNSFDFCSHLYTDANPKCASLTSWPKTVSKYFQKNQVTVTHMMAIYYELRNDPELLAILAPYIDARYLECQEPAKGTVAGQSL
jgi:hypothetical protein